MSEPIHVGLANIFGTDTITAEAMSHGTTTWLSITYHGADGSKLSQAAFLPLAVAKRYAAAINGIHEALAVEAALEGVA